jgi:hypothetical protein
MLNTWVSIIQKKIFLGSVGDKKIGNKNPSFSIVRNIKELTSD